LHKRCLGCCKDNTGNPLPGVNIIEKGTQNGVSTDSDGSYKIKVKEGATLVLVTYFLLEKAVTAAVMNVSLSEEGGQA
jgi:iron complex outermembrane receptor protein